MIWDVEKQEAI